MSWYIMLLNTILQAAVKRVGVRALFLFRVFLCLCYAFELHSTLVRGF